jgi:ribose transport system permease protein
MFIPWQGSPKDARAKLNELVSQQINLQVIAGNQTTVDWLVFDNIPSDFPALGSPQLIGPSVYTWPNFLKKENLLNITNQIAVIAIIAIGMTVVIISGGIDLSVGSLIAFSAVLCCLFIQNLAGALDANTGGMVFACVAAILITGLVGSFTGSMITAFAIPPFIVTLGIMMMASGTAYLMSGGESVYQVPDSFVWLGREASLFGIPNAVFLMVFLYVVAHIMMSRTRLGRYIYAVGGNPEAARLSGVPVKRVQLFAYTLCGLLAGLGGIVMASQLKSGAPTYGQMYELYVIAAVVVGGTSLSGGEGKIFGTLIGAFIIAVIQNGMNLMNIESYTQKVILGMVILIAVLLDKLKQKSFRTA